MTLNDIIYAALRQLERGTDAQTVDKFRRVFTDYANSGQRRLANRFKVTRLETVKLDDKGRFNVDSLERSCVLIEKITDGNGAVMSWDEIVTGLIEVTNGANADVNVYYRYMPREMSSPTDVPELPLICTVLSPIMLLAVSVAVQMQIHRPRQERTSTCSTARCPTYIPSTTHLRTHIP